MSDPSGGADRAARRSKRFLFPSQKYEIWLQLVRQEVTIAEAATAQHVDRSTIMRIRTRRQGGRTGGAGRLQARSAGQGTPQRYNRRRRHSAIGMLTPVQFETAARHTAALAA